MKCRKLTYFLLFILSIYHAQAQKDATSHLRAVSKFDNGERRLSIWSSFLNLLKCPPGPLGRDCSTDSGSSGSSSSHSSSGSGNKSSGNNNSSNNSSGSNASGANSSSSGGDTSTSWWTGGGSGTAGAQAARKSGGAWMLIVGIVGIAATALAFVAYKTSKNQAVGESGEAVVAASGDHQLKGAVKKRQKAFTRVVRKGLGWRRTNVSDEALA